MSARQLQTIGWREWVALPSLGVTAVKAKVDTGALSSALHAYDIELFACDGRTMVRFKLHPFQRNHRHAVSASAPLVDHRWIRSSSGHRALRPAIVTAVELGGLWWETELTLTNRDPMGFRMLLGRRSLRRRFLVDPGRSYVCGRELAVHQKRHRTRKRREQDHE